MALTEAQFMLVRDAVVVTFALGLGAYEVVAGGARPAVLTWITGLLVSPIVLRTDRLRRNGST
jgi:hypothetical protein